MTDAIQVVHQPYGHAGRTVGAPDTSRVVMVNGMDVTPEELRAAGAAVADTLLNLTALDPGPEDKGALVEVALSLGVSTEPTVRGAVAHHAWETQPPSPRPAASPDADTADTGEVT